MEASATSKVIKECNSCVTGENGHDRSTAKNGHQALQDCTDIGETAKKNSTDELLEQLRAAKRQIVLQSQRIEELESYLGCIVTLSAKVRELELDASL
jgi:hypothetical protein